MGDDQLLRQAQSGDEVALDQLVRREWRPLYALIYRLVQDRTEAEDLTQESLLRALMALDRFHERGIPFSAYLTTVARNVVRNHWRKRRPHLLYLDALPEISCDENGPESTALAADRQRHWDHLLADLPVDYQTVIRLRIYEDRSTAEVAAMMRRSPEAVRVLQHRAIAALRNRLPKGTHRG
jgi:RNA polymerase sigma-70 factor (ECF subfamily)